MSTSDIDTTISTSRQNLVNNISYMVQSESQSFFDISILPEPYKTLSLVQRSICATNGQYLILFDD
jgi:hypothetical protein